ncbi:MAG: hypothetical protein WKF55_10655 [Gemmatimonadaceae bacterium]
MIGGSALAELLEGRGFVGDDGGKRIPLHSFTSRGQGQFLVDLVSSVQPVQFAASAVPVPVVACGGARNVGDFLAATRDAEASAVAAGSIFEFQGVHRAVLVNFPSVAVLNEQLFIPLSAGSNV